MPAWIRTAFLVLAALESSYVVRGLGLVPVEHRVRGFSLAEPSRARPSTSPITLRRHFTPQDREKGRYQYVPVDVPPGVTQLTIEYQYDRAGGANVIDLGLMEPGPLDLGTRSFRGWSGGARTSVTVAPTGSTPGYTDGPIAAGRWHVILGLYKIVPTGADVTVTAEMTTEDVPSIIGVGRGGGFGVELEVGAPVRWYSGAVHVHTVHSDGKLTPNEVLQRAGSAGLDFVAMTDHNTTTHQRDLTARDAPLAIVGEEITTPGGHANALGLRPNAWIDFRVSPKEAGAASKIASLVDATHRAGALFVINHPAAECDACGWTHAVPDEVDAVEIWNGSRDNAPQPAAVALWDRLLRAGRHVTAVGASDFHDVPTPIDQPAVRVQAARLETEAILQAIKHGRVVVTRDARVPVPLVTAAAGGGAFSPGDTIPHCGAPLRVEVNANAVTGGRAELIWNGESTASAPISGRVQFTRACERGYARVHVYDATGAIVAVTNPIYVEPR